MSNGVSAATTEARREILLAILRRGSRPMTSHEVLEEQRALHELGNWPQAEWTHARNEPYDSGTRQMLMQLVGRGRCLHQRDERNRDTWLLPQPADLLPVGEERDRVMAALLAYEKLTGCWAIVGVTEDLARVVRVETMRGAIEYQLDRSQSWEEGLRDVGLA